VFTPGLGGLVTRGFDCIWNTRAGGNRITVTLFLANSPASANGLSVHIHMRPPYEVLAWRKENCQTRKTGPREITHLDEEKLADSCCSRDNLSRWMGSSTQTLQFLGYMLRKMGAIRSIFGAKMSPLLNRHLLLAVFERCKSPLPYGGASETDRKEGLLVSRQHGLAAQLWALK